MLHINVGISLKSNHTSLTFKFEVPPIIFYTNFSTYVQKSLTHIGNLRDQLPIQRNPNSTYSSSRMAHIMYNATYVHEFAYIFPDECPTPIGDPGSKLLIWLSI